MAGERLPVILSAIDEERFGIRTARCSAMTAELLPAVLSFCRENQVSLAIARCLVDDLSAVQAMERAGFFLADTLIYYTRDLVNLPLPVDTGQVPVRPVRPGEETAVLNVAAAAFHDYSGHYHADKRLDRALCDQVYASWAWRACLSREVADQVLVADLQDTVVGFAVLRLNGPEEGEGVLYGVAPASQGRGIYRSLLIQSMSWVRLQGAQRMLYSTQITNMAAQKTLARLGFEPSHAYYTLHKWFDQGVAGERRTNGKPALYPL